MSDTQSVATGTFSNVSILTSDPTEVVVYSQLRAVEYVPTIEYSVSGETITFVTPPATNEVIQVFKRGSFYTNLTTITGNASTNFGSSLATNSDGSVLTVGSDTAVVGTHGNEGLLYAYHRTITEFTTDGTSSSFTAPDAFANDYRVLLNGVGLVEGSDC